MRLAAEHAGGPIVDHVQRARLVEKVSSGHLLVVEARAGAGKSTLVGDLAADHDGPTIRVALTEPGSGPVHLRRLVHGSLHRSGLSDLADGLEQATADDVPALLLSWLEVSAEPVLLIIDDLHHAAEPLAAMVMSLVTDWPRDHRLCLGARRLPESLRGPILDRATTLVGPADLRFQAAEVRFLLGDELGAHLDDSEVALLTSRCDGWAAALVVVRNRLRRALRDGDQTLGHELRALLSGPVTLPHLLGELLAGLPPQRRAAIRDLATLPYLDDELAADAGIDSAAVTLAGLGFPIEADGLRRWRFPDAIRDVLASEIADERVTRLAADHYLGSGDGGAAIGVLMAAGLHADLAKLLADLPPGLRGTLDPSEQAAAINALPPSLLAAHPGILIHLADTHIVAGDQFAYRDCIRRARSLFGAADLDDPGLSPAALEVLAADLSMRAVAADDDRWVPELEALIVRPDLPPMARGRLLGAVARAIASRRTVAALRAALLRIDEAAQVLDHEGAVAHAVAIRVVGASFIAWPLGRYDAALGLLDRALQDARGNVRIRVAILPYRAFILIDLGRYAEAEAVLAELRQTATTVGLQGNERSAVFARWGAAKLASQRDDAAGTWAALRAVEHAEVPVDTGHGAFFRADAAQLLARVGRHDDARRFLAAARDRDPGTTPLLTTGMLAVAAYGGSLDDAETAWRTLDEGRAVEPRERWRVTLLHAFACHRAGDPRARELAGAAFEQAAQLGVSDLPLIREPQAARALLPLAAGSSASARDAERHHSAQLRLLGGYELAVDGRSLEPTGRPGELLALIVLQGGQARVEEAVDLLWPDATLDRGRERLRTVLRRMRRDLGDLIQRHEHSLRLVDEVRTDVGAFLRFVGQAEADPSRVDAANAALALYRGDLATSLGTADWVETAREHLRARALRMHDLVAAAAHRDGRLDEAVRVLGEAIESDPLHEDRRVAMARLLAEQGRRSSAVQVLAETRGLLAMHQLTPSSAFERFEAYLLRDPAPH